MVGQAAVAIDNANLFTDLQQANIEMVMAYDSTLEGWAKALELRDMETEGHSRRVVDLTLRLAQMFDIGEKQLVHVRRGALLHDIGKMGIPDTILQKPGPLDDAEWAIMRQHPVLCLRMAFPHHLSATCFGYPLLPSRKVGWQWLPARLERRSKSPWRPESLRLWMCGMPCFQTAPTARPGPKGAYGRSSRNNPEHISTPRWWRCSCGWSHLA